MEKLEYKLPSLSEVNKGFKLWKAVKAMNIHLYFDSSSLVDMLVGVESLFPGKEFKDHLYKDSCNLVYAIAYRKWLGNLHVLPPHAEELIDNIQSNKRLFSTALNPDVQEHINELWGRLLDTEDLKKLKLISGKNQVVTQEILTEIQQHSYHPFLWMYLSNQGGNWKKRFKYLVKEAHVIQFVDDYDSSNKIDELAKSPLFGKLMRKLNAGKRTARTVNNHVDALALCILNEKLNQFIDGKSPYLPLFYCNQESIFEVVRSIQEEHKDSQGRKPFMYESDTHEPFSIIQNSSYFIIQGFFKAMEINNDQLSLDNFYRSLSNIVEAEPDRGYASDLKADLAAGVHETVMLEFFARWWQDNGLHELLEHLSLKEDPNQGDLSKLVNDHIEEARQKLALKIQGFGSRYTLIKKAWHALKRFKTEVQDEVIDTKLKINAYNDFGPRFNFSDSVCKIIQDWIDQAVIAVGENDNEVCQSVQSEVINDLISVLFEKIDHEGFAPEKLDQLAASIGFFFCFHKYELVAEVCAEIRRKYLQEFKSNQSDDKYPVHSIALIHAASLFQEDKHSPSATAEDEALEIIKCVESKAVENYKVWIGLAYLYILLWKYPIDGYKFRELMSVEDYQKILLSNSASYQNQAIIYCKNTLDYLEARINKDPAKYSIRSRKYYYVLNIYIFLNTFYLDIKNFLLIKPFAKKLEAISSKTSLFQESRFSDTLARFYFRLAIVCQNEEKYHRYVQKAKALNERASKSEPKQLYQDLRDDIIDWETEGGFEAARETCLKFESLQV